MTPERNSEVPNALERLAIRGLTILLEGTSFCLTDKQRRAIQELYGYRCMAKELGMPGPHRGRIEINHDPPQSDSIVKGLDPDGDHVAYFPLCEAHHDQYHNGDISKAKEEFRKGNKDAYKQMSQRNKENAEKGIVFWQDKYSPKMHEIYKRAVEEGRAQGWQFPPKAEKRQR